MSEVVKFSVAATVNAKRAMGICDEQIAYTLNLHPRQVRAVPLPRPDAPRSRAVQHQQLMKMAQTLMPRVEAGEQQAIQLMLKVMQREASLLGLDAPKQFVNLNKDLTVREIPTAELERMLIEGTCEVVPNE